MPAPSTAEPQHQLVLRRAVERWPMEERSRLDVLELDAAGRGTVTCGGARHAIVLDDARDDLVLEHHDEVAETAMVAFGARPPACLVYACAWRDAFRTRGFMASWAAVERPTATAQAHRRHDWDENFWENWPTDPAAAAVLFGPDTQDELGLRIARRWVHAPSDDRLRLLALAVRVRARARFVASIAGLEAHRKPDALVPLRVEVHPAVDTAGMFGRLAMSGSSVVLRLPTAWLWAVWGAGVALVDGHFTLARSGAGVRVVQWCPSGGPDRVHVPEERELPTPAGAPVLR